MSSLSNHFYQFGTFSVDIDQRVLLREGKPVALTPKTLETLVILLESSGRIVEKDELKRRLWPDTFVEDTNITFNIQQVRKALGDDARNPRFVETVARRGYRFIAPVEVRSNDAQDLTKQTTQVSSVDAEEGLIASAVPSTGINRKFWGLGLLALVVLVGVAVIIWKVVNISSIADPRTTLSTKVSIKPHLKVEQLTATGQSDHVAITPDGRYVAYERVFENKGAIWVRQLGANTNVELIPPSGIIYGLAFNNSGDYLYFVRGNPTALYRVSLVGGLPTKIVDSLEGNFSISRDNSQIVFVRQSINKDGQRVYSLITAKSDGTGEHQWFTSSYPYGLDTPMWAPDGRSVVCSYGSTTGGSQDVTVIEVSLADGQKKDLSSAKFFRITKMAWLAQDSGLLLSARTRLGENNHLWKLSFPSMELTQLTEGVTSYADLSLTADGQSGVASQETMNCDLWVGSNRDPKTLKRITQATDNFGWAPDGRLVYSSTASGNRDLWIMQRDGSGQRQITVDPAMDVSPRVTSDNRYIVFISNRTGAFQVWRMNIDGSNQTQLTNGDSKNYISISPDGKWVLYNTTNDWHLWKISIDGGEPVKLGGYVGILGSMSPDQKTIVCVGRDGDKRLLLMLPASGGQPFKRIDLAAGNFASDRLMWTADGNSLIYMAERDGPIMIYKQPLNGGTPQEIARFDQDELFDFDYSADGQFLAVTRGGWRHDVVLISNLNQ